MVRSAKADSISACFSNMSYCLWDQSTGTASQLTATIHHEEVGDLAHAPMLNEVALVHKLPLPLLSFASLPTSNHILISHICPDAVVGMVEPLDLTIRQEGRIPVRTDPGCVTTD